MKQFFLLPLMLLSFAAGAQNFITRWAFDRNSQSITINGITEGDVVCRWTSTSTPAGGTFKINNTNENYPINMPIPIAAGDTVTLSMEPQNLRRFFMAGGLNGANARELIEVRQWGAVPWTSMEVAFQNCPNFKLIATDVPNLSGVTSMKQMFWYSPLFVPPFNIDLWDVSNVTDMESLFAETGSFNRHLGAWNLSSLTNASAMFSNSGISCENYSLTLKGWANNPNTASNVNFAFQRNTIYANTAVPFRNALIAKSWGTSWDAIATPGSSCYDMVLPVTFDNISATLKNGSLQVSWTTLTETGNSHFEIEASADGKSFATIGRVLTKAHAGNSSVPLNYDFRESINGTALMACIGILLLGVAGFGSSHRKKYLLIILAVAGVGLSISGCTKNELSAGDEDSVLYVRIKQVDENGDSKYSKVVKAIKK
ncbi:MAG TPA: BspA family leucine-rich repeat surface protein [Niabella sp.]|nr:BspA family leucine-rich repeat surface protein [Niabella sp.]